MHRFLTLLAVLIGLALAAPGGQAQSAHFLSVMTEMPLMPGLVEVPDAAVEFDGPTGRIIEALAAGAVGVDAVRSFYAATLPQLGWTVSAPGVYRRDAEILNLSVTPAPAGAKGAAARFVLRPAAAK